MEPTREILWNVGMPTRVSMYVLAAVTAVVFAYGMYRHYQVWRTGRPGPALGDVAARIKRVGLNALVQVKTARSAAGWVAHAGILWGFIALFIGTCLVGIEHYGILTFLHGQFYLVFSFVLDLFGLLFIIGILVMLGRRVLGRKYCPPTHVSDIVVLLLALAVAVTGFGVEAYRIVAQRETSSFETASFVGWAMAGMVEGKGISVEAATGRHFVVWWVHMILVYVLLGAIPYTKLLHMFVAPVSMLLIEESKPGRLAPLSMEEVEETGKFGVEAASDFTRRQLLSFDACIRCGRCYSACPAYATGKPLSPMKVVLSIRDGATSPDSLHGRSVEAETLWSCTTCRACEEECPVLIDHLTAIVDMRRHLVGEGQIRGSEQTALRNISATGNPWGLPNDERMDWAKDLDVPTVEDNPSPDVLFWVGCAGAFDRRNQKVTQAMVKILHAAGVNFAVLGKRERCTGDAARRLGDEFTFQEVAMQNVETLNGVQFKQIVTACAHCFSTLKNEYPDFDGHYDVQHHTQFLRRLVDEGRIPTTDGKLDGIVLHDPCYVGRHNGEYDAPRETLREGLQLSLPLLETDRSREESFCCGAGGGRMWAEEAADQRVNLSRWEQLKATGAGTIATACPFCMTMLDDAAKEDEAAGMQVKDVAELIAEAIDPKGN